ncbi:helix-turn-helix transcriptional regulator [Ensifer sp. T173]|uniref:Helix-turn-helix transcriptional regulator n=1 Tax=Ensifer canadensis TaxID=555315 RepID=A0AAW4FKJ4_9HYPH|nr:helix-turn-helix transcriptional regulator [Ensifer canadensis]MBM3091030.1 helix-turn-helix transcriptional regulator [Ensifer canadensis]UBI75913.1 helix-turn-helix transcriptional regulator [Ensifer canadensis]
MFRTGTANTEELIYLIYGAAFGECSWEDFLSRLAGTVPNGKSALHYHDLAAPASHVPYVSGFTADDLDQFNNHFAAVNPWIPRTVLVPVGRGLCGEHIVSREDLVKSEFYNDWLKRQTGCETSVGVTIIRDATRTFILSTCTTSTDAEFNHHAADQYTSLAPHLKRAFEFVRKRDVMTVERQQGQSLLDSIGVGLMYVGENLRVRSMNEHAQRISATGAPIRIATGGRLTLSCPQTSAALEALTLRGCTDTRPHVSIVKGAGGTAYRITLLKLNSDAFTELLSGPTVAVVIEPTTSLLPEVRSRHLEDIYGLTPAEIRIASGLAAGLSLREIALANSVSYETIRTQLKSIYSKTQVNSQAALVSLLMR